MTALLSAEAVQSRLARAFLTATVPDPDALGIGRPVAEDRNEAVAVAMRVVGPVVEAYLAEIGRLRDEVKAKSDEVDKLRRSIAAAFKAAADGVSEALDEGLKEVEAAARAGERERCARLLREQAEHLAVAGDYHPERASRIAGFSQAADLLEAGQPEGVPE